MDYIVGSLQGGLDIMDYVIELLQAGLEETYEEFIHELEKKYDINLENEEDRKFEKIMVTFFFIVES